MRFTNSFMYVQCLTLFVIINCHCKYTVNKKGKCIIHLLLSLLHCKKDKQIENMNFNNTLSVVVVLLIKTFHDFLQNFVFSAKAFIHTVEGGIIAE